jgi:anti-sigma factor ChrR (cupin superfamily)
MSNACPSRDESLLLFAHGQLGFWASMGVKWHARKCPHCRERLARYSSLSGLLATAMAAPTGPRWLPAATFKVAALRGTVFLLIAGLLSFGIWSLNATASASAAPTPSQGSKKCFTNLKAVTPPKASTKDCGEPKSPSIAKVGRV